MVHLSKIHLDTEMRFSMHIEIHISSLDEGIIFFFFLMGAWGEETCK